MIFDIGHKQRENSDVTGAFAQLANESEIEDFSQEEEQGQLGAWYVMAALGLFDVQGHAKENNHAPKSMKSRKANKIY